jgi:hypothetical protein
VLESPLTPSAEDKERIAGLVPEALRERTGIDPSPEEAARVSVEAILQAQAQLLAAAEAQGAPVALAEPTRPSRVVGSSRIVIPQGIVSAGGVPDLSDAEIRQAIAAAIDDFGPAFSEATSADAAAPSEAASSDDALQK